MILEAFGSMARAPIDWQYLSKMGEKEIPPFMLFHIPPPAVPTYKLI